MLPTAEYWKGVRRLSRIARQHRSRKAEKLMPAVEEICRRLGITIRCIDHGIQFTRDEYVIVWCPSTNRVSISYKLSGSKTVPFLKDGKPGKPRIIVALEELEELIRGENRPREVTGKQGKGS